MSCNPKSQNITMFAGNDLLVIVEVRDQSGALVDISDASAIVWEVARNVNSTPVITKSLGSGITINSPTSFSFLISDTESGALSGVYYHEAEVTTSAGYVYTTLSGRLSIRPALI